MRRQKYHHTGVNTGAVAVAVPVIPGIPASSALSHVSSLIKTSDINYSARLEPPILAMKHPSRSRYSCYSRFPPPLPKETLFFFYWIQPSIEASSPSKPCSHYFSRLRYPTSPVSWTRSRLAFQDCSRLPLSKLRQFSSSVS